ncbi:hypothetical protein EYF80_023640 [Liparis tanakae]|uniref:Uncharacterized protein n=1 Tax=Liparis tanakae TaxID=230148 RepID=A0A4Z2HMZ7_9TELE|nr:hypothetical protein EYF80_023640 [Liparis tanakae]
MLRGHRLQGKEPRKSEGEKAGRGMGGGEGMTVEHHPPSKAHHVLQTPYLNTPSQERGENRLFFVYERALDRALFSISIYGAAV